MSNTLYNLERTLARAGFPINRWQMALIISVVFLVVMLCADKYILHCDGQTCTITKQKQLMGLFPKTVEQFEQAEVKDFDISCSQHADHHRTSRRGSLYRALNKKNTHKVCKLQIVLNDDTLIDTHQSECYSSFGLQKLFQDIKYGEVINRENWGN